jgi:hypothetical protein
MKPPLTPFPTGRVRVRRPLSQEEHRQAQLPLFYLAQLYHYTYCIPTLPLYYLLYTHTIIMLLFYPSRPVPLRQALCDEAADQEGPAGVLPGRPVARRLRETSLRLLPTPLHR